MKWLDGRKTYAAIGLWVLLKLLERVTEITVDPMIWSATYGLLCVGAAHKLAKSGR